MNNQNHTPALLTTALTSATLASLVILGTFGASESHAQVAPPPIILQGVVRDFTASHPDFGPSASFATGHVAKSVGPMLDLFGRPSYAGLGQSVTSDWIDKDLNAIQPYGELGLPGGHFDVDVYDVEGSTSEYYHEHEYDDLHNVTYVDIVNDLNLLYDALVSPAYPNDIRVELANVHNGGGGTYALQAAGPRQTGITASGFTTVFSPASLTEFRINFVTLADMRQTQPSDSQSDSIDRDDSLRIRMYDTISNVMIYELVVYNHLNTPEVIPVLPPKVGNDACAVPFNDTVGTYGAAADGGITSGDTFNQWFSSDPAVNASATSEIVLNADAQGVYSYSTNSFFPADNQLFGNEGAAHNNFFTYSLSTTFIYHSCTGQFMEFEGNDDAWVYINGELVLDLGGIGNGALQFVALDRLNLVDGQIYPLDFFYAQRRETLTSVFNMRTNIQLRSAVEPTSSLYD